MGKTIFITYNWSQVSKKDMARFQIWLEGCGFKVFMLGMELDCPLQIFSLDKLEMIEMKRVEEMFHKAVA